MANQDRAELGRNDPCHCGSGKKYKKCCSDKDRAERSAAAAASAAKRAASADTEAAAGAAPKGARGARGGGSVSRPKGPPPKSPTQLRRRAV
jgi:hypothetical protein